MGARDGLRSSRDELFGSSIRSILAQRDRDNGQKAVETGRMRPAAARPGAGWASCLPPKGARDCLCRRGDAVARELLPVPRASPAAAISLGTAGCFPVPALNARSCRRRQRGGIWDRRERGRGEAGRSHYMKRQRGKDPQKV